jgi:hypothetical protein
LLAEIADGMWMYFEPNEPTTSCIHPRFNIC